MALCFTASCDSNKMESHIGFLMAVIVGTFVVTHFVQAQNQQGFISLDCGMSMEASPYEDPSSGLTFTSDASFTQTGKSGRVQRDLERSYMKPYLDLRYFPDGRRNCYSLNVTRDTNYMIVAVFHYGNYDGLDTYPSFDLYLGPNKWTTIDMEGRVNGTREELIHKANSNALDVCLVKTGTTTPFISSLELRPLSNDTYLAKSGSMRLSFSRIHGGNLQIRYPNDVHDRTWFPFSGPNWTPLSTALEVNDSNIYEIPKNVLKTGFTPTNASAPLILTWHLDSPKAEAYLYLHFAEIQSLQANETREFNIMVNGNLSHSAFTPPKYEIYTFFDSTGCDKGACNLQLVRTEKSTLPPLISAVEAFEAIELPRSGTNPNDVAGVRDIKATYGLRIISWQGDPCVPQVLLWENLKCNYTDISTPPRIISLNLSARGLVGNIAPCLQNLTQLQELDLSNNNLTGEVPKFLANMTSLLVINLSGNNLHGSVPQALLDREKNGLKLLLEGNKELCKSSSCGNDKRKIIVTVIVSVGSAAIIVVVAIVIFVLKKKKASAVIRSSSSARVKKNRIVDPSEPKILSKKRRFSYSEVAAMTNNGRIVLGKGGFGAVYHGFLNDTEQVAIKMLSHYSTQGQKQFKAEVELLLRVHHINLVSLVGYCDEGDHLALVYEYMPNGDLKQHLSGKRGGFVLSWARRISIAIDAALGLEYLHTGCKPPIVHRDIKSTNILLDERFHAKLADFGLSRSFPPGTETHVSTVVAGTPGYLDPEYYHTNWLTEKSDVYSFGIVLLELVTNQPVIDQAREKPYIADYVGFTLTRGDMENIMDPSLRGDYGDGSAWKAVELAMSCVNPSSTGRPSMSQVVQELKDCLKSEYLRTGESQSTDPKSSVQVSLSFSSEMIPHPR